MSTLADMAQKQITAIKDGIAQVDRQRAAHVAEANALAGRRAALEGELVQWEAALAEQSSPAVEIGRAHV